MSDVMEKRMKLIVVAEFSSKPRDWQFRHVLVLAETAEQAREMAEESNSVAEVDLQEPAVLL